MLTQEATKLDIELALTYEGKENLWENLLKSKAVDLPGIITAEEIEKQKYHILDVWYKDKEHQEISSNKWVIYETNIDYIHKVIDSIKLIFKEFLF